MSEDDFNIDKIVDKIVDDYFDDTKANLIKKGHEYRDLITTQQMKIHDLKRELRECKESKNG